MRKLLIAAILLLATGTAGAASKVYMTREISPEALVKIYKMLGRPATGHRVAVKISSGEGGNNHYLKPELIRNLVDTVNGVIVECNTAYAGSRNTSEAHWETMKNHGFTELFAVDILDESGDMQIPVKDRKHLKYDIVGDHLSRYDYMVNLAHFKGHQMGGFGGVLKNASIGVASSAGKAYIHSAGGTSDVNERKIFHTDQDSFLESMAAAAQAVHDYFGENIVYINVMNNMSVDCDCNGHPAAPELADYGILASTDPVALDQACTDIIFNMEGSEGNDNEPLKERITSRHGLHTIDHAAEIGLGSKEYELISID